MRLKELKRRGQVMVLWALLTPLLIVFVGAGIDLGWYYLTVSRLQNAADAAALAGAMKLVEKNQDLSDYYVYSLSNPPTDLLSDYTIYYVDEETQSYTGKTINEAPGKADAKKYANKNLSATEDTNKVTDGWNTIKKNETVNFASVLYAKAMDIQQRENGLKYYQVTLTEKVSHLFLRGWDPMEAKVVAYALLKPHDVDLVTIINQLEKSKIIANWEYQVRYRNYMGNWNHYRYSIDGHNTKAVSYTLGDSWRWEKVNVAVDWDSSSGNKTSANGGNYYSQDKVDSINIDFNQDVSFSAQFTTDWDLRSESAPAGTTISPLYNYGWDATHGADLRIQGLINFNGAWEDRNLNDLKPDILWTRIESDPMWSRMKWGTQNSLNSVHQMIMNVHTDNTATTTAYDKNNTPYTVYKYRPFFVFYMGPETNYTNVYVTNLNKNEYLKSLSTTFSEDTFIRKSQPVILNLYEDWNAIIYMPHSPVIINGNGHNLNGFVIAEEYLQLKEDSDYIGKGYISVKDKYGYTLFVKSGDLITEAQFAEISEAYSVTPDSAQGTFSLYEVPEAPKYMIIEPRYVKGVEGYTDSAHVTALKKYRNVTDADLTRITFPQNLDSANGYSNTQSYAVVKSDLLDTNPEPNATLQNANYAAVITSDNQTKYIAKTNLPYVRVYRNSGGNLYPYVPVCDLKVKVGTATESPYAGVTLADDDHDVYSGGNVVNSLKDYVIDEKKDTWKVTRTPLEKIYQVNYKNGYISKSVDADGNKYFMLTTEMSTKKTLIAEYRKVTRKLSDGTEETLYLKEQTTAEYNRDGAKYYMKVVPDGASGKDADGYPVENPIILDNKGDLQVKPTPLGHSSYKGKYYRATNDDEQPDDPTVYKTLKDKVTGELKDYRDLSLEVVYYKDKAFNLGDDSYYSYFQIPSLRRINYLYLNVNELDHTVNDKPSDKYQVDDMFFTTKRASWID